MSTLQPFARTQSVIEYFRAAVLLDGSRPLIDDGRSALSRARAYAAAIGLAHQLARTLPRGAPVGLYLGNETSVFVALMACAAAGCPHVLLDVSYPAQRNRRIVASAGIRAVVERVERPFPEEGCPAGVARLAMAEFDAREPDVGTLVAPRPIGRDEPFAIIYTSGSTGEPKGIVHSERSLLQCTLPDIEMLGIGRDDRILGLWSPSAIGGVRHLLSAPIAGNLCVVRDARSGLQEALETIRANRITIARMVPALFRALAHVEGAREAFASLRCVTMGGERAYGSDIALLRDVLPPGCRISIGYGSTESGTIAQWFAEDFTGGVVPCGRAFAGTSLEVVDAVGRCVADGEIGELRSSGPATALGMWHAGAIVSDGFATCADDPSSRSFRTGDLFRRDRDGLLTLCGRIDRMVKIRGHRVDLGDVEAAIRACDGVRECAVVASSESADARLDAFVVGDAQAIAGLRDRLRADLPAHMLPRVTRIDAIPYLPGFKPDVAALHARLAGEAAAPAPAIARWVDDGTIPIAVREAWDAVLGRGSSRRGERWEDAGGDSLRTLVLAFDLERRLGHAIPMSDFSSDMDPKTLAERLERRFAGEAAAAHAANVLLFAGQGGDTPRLVTFRRYLGAGHTAFVPVYPDWAGLERDGDAMGRLVEHTLAQIDAIEIAQPLVLVGYSLGAYVAFEVARRLRARGTGVSLLILLDVPADGYRIEDEDEAVASRAGAFATAVGSLGIGRTLARSLGYRLAHAALRHPRLRRTLARNKARLPQTYGAAFYFAYYATTLLRVAAVRRWRPKPIDVPIVLYRARTRWNNPTRDLGWAALSPAVTVHDVAGSHTTMLAEADGVALAQHVSRAITSAPSPGDLLRA